MARVIMEQSFDAPLPDDAYDKMAKQLDPELDARKAMWRRSYVSSDKRRVLCEFEAPNEAAVRDAVRATGQRFDRIWAADVTSVEDYPDSMERLRKLGSK